MNYPPDPRDLAPYNVQDSRVSFPRGPYQGGPILSEPQKDPIPYGRILWRAKYLVLALVLLGTMAGFVFVIFEPPRYRAAVTLEVTGFNEAFMGMSQYDPQAGTGSNAGNMQTQMRILQSRFLLSRVFETLDRDMAPVLPTPTGLIARIRTKLYLNPREPVVAMKDAIKVAASTLAVRPVGTSRILEVSCDSIAPEVAASFVNALANEYLSQNLQLRSNSAVKTSQWLDSQTEETKAKLEQSEQQLKDFLKTSGSQILLEQDSLAGTKLKQLQGDLAAIQAQRIAKETRYNLAKANPIDSLPEILDDGTLRALRTQVTQLRTEMAQLSADLTPKHDKVKRVAAQIAELEASMKKAKGDLVKSIQNEYEASLKQEKSLSAAYNGQARMLANMGERSGQYATLKRDVEANRQAYNTLVQQSHQAGLVSAVPTNNARILDLATPSPEPYKPDPLSNCLTGAALGGAIAASFLFLREIIQRRKLAQQFVTPQDVVTTLNVPGLGVIPAADEPAGRKSFWAWQNKRGNLRLRANEEAASLPHPQVELATWKQKPSMLAESFRFALTSLMVGKAGSTPPQAVVVTSCGPGEGKTTVATNLAIALAETGRRILLVDGDLRRPRLHSVFNIEKDPGFADLMLAPAGTASDNIAEYIQATEVPNLSVLPSGTCDQDLIHQIFTSRKLPRRIAQFREMFDMVLIDVPPVLQFAESRLLACLTEGIVLVIRASHTSRESALAARRHLFDDEVPILGTILNDWRPAGDQVPGYYYYSHAQQSSPAEDHD